LVTRSEQRRQALLLCYRLVLLAAASFCWLALLTFDPADWPSSKVWPHPTPPHNLCGSSGAWIAYHLFYWFGSGGYVIVLFVTVATLAAMLRGSLNDPWLRVLGVAFLVAGTAASVRMISPGGADSLPQGNGGIVGIAIVHFLRLHCSSAGTALIILCGIGVGLLLAAEGLAIRVPSAVGRLGQQAVLIADSAVQALTTPGVEEKERDEPERLPPPPRRREARNEGTRERASLRHWPAWPRLGWFGRKPVADVERSIDDGFVECSAEAEDNRPVARGAEKAKRVEASESAVPTRSHENRPTEVKEDAVRSAIDQPEVQDLLQFPGVVPEVLDAGVTDRIGPPGCRAEDNTPAVQLEERDVEAIEVKPISSEDAPIRNLRRSKPVLAQARVEPHPYPKDLGRYDLPHMNVLDEPEYGYMVQQESVVREKAKVLEQTLGEFRLDARVVEIETGPVITMYELSLAPGIKVSQIVSLSNDIARSLKAPAVRVVAPIPGKDTIGIEVPNVDKENVRLKELILMSGNRPAKMQLPLFLGKDAGGNPLVGDLAKMPHMLIAGTTGSGKSVCLNSIVMSILMTQRPDMVKMILVDPKMVEMSVFKDVPHLMCPVVTDMNRAEMILDWAATKMDERYELLAEAGAKNIAGYNQMTREQLDAAFQPASEEERAKIPYPLPYIVIIIDELADLMMTAAKEVEHHLSRLAQKSRAVGIHIVVATQRPEAKVVTGLIKSNLPCRIAFRVASRMDSRIVLDQNGAEVLMGQGDMLFLPPGSSKLVRAQGCYVSDDELKRTIEFLSKQTEPEFHPELINIGNAGGSSSGERDPLFEEAARIIIESGRGSVSLLQRRLTIGYGRASRLIDQMGEVGIVGPYKGSQAREVLVTLDEWDELKEQLANQPKAALVGVEAGDDFDSEE